MCRGCWEEYGAPTALPDGADDAIALIREIYGHPAGAAGGPLHVQLDDWNIGGTWTLPAWDFPDDLVRLASRLCRLMNAWPVGERAAVLAAFEGWKTDGGEPS